jgi:hypothetical protein
MHLELMRTKDKEFPAIDEPETITSARIWYCTYTSLESISKLINLKTLTIASYPDSSLEPLSALHKLESLELVHFPNVKSLLPLSDLKELKKLSLSTLPSWDSSGKTIVVKSLEPIAKLNSLEELSLFGVVPESKDVEALLTSPSLKKVRISKYPKSEQQKINARYGV